MQRSDRIILQKIINAVEVSLKVFNDISLEKILKDNEMKLAISMTILNYKLIFAKDIVESAKTALDIKKHF